MDKQQEEIFKEFTYSYSQRFKHCFCSTTGEKWPAIFSKNHYGRFRDYLEDKHRIEIKLTDIKAYKLYEEIMVKEINKFIEECKQEQSKRDKEAAKNKNVKRKRD